MRYPRKFVQRVGLVLTLLIGGVLGGLMTPLQSEALPPTVTLKVDNGTAVSILSTTNTSSVCTATELSLGFTHCYAINTALTVDGVPPTGVTARSYNVRNAPGATARLRVADNAGNDKFSLIGVIFVPAVLNWGSTTANTSETHVLTLTMFNAFDSTTNLNNKGTYVWALRAGGEFRAGPAGTGATACGALACNTIGNSVVFPGTGTFSTALTNTSILSPTGSAANTSPLSFTVAGPTAPIVSFNGLTNATLGQVNPTYPTFVCDQNGGTLATGDVCKPSITLTMTVTLRGPDSFVLVNGHDAYGANCDATLTAKELKKIAFLTKLMKFLTWWESIHANSHLSAFIDRIEAFLATVNTVDPECGGATLVNLDIATAAALDQAAFTASGAEVAENAPHHYVVANSPGLTWGAARDAAKLRGEGCDLATITSAEEQAIINDQLGSSSVYTGTIQDYWIGGIQAGASTEPGGHWQWINGEGEFWDNGSTGMYANWGSLLTCPTCANEPNNAGGNENHLTVDSRYLWGWNDLDGIAGTTKGYIVEGTVGSCVID